MHSPKIFGGNSPKIFGDNSPKTWLKVPNEYHPYVGGCFLSVVVAYFATTVLPLSA